MENEIYQHKLQSSLATNLFGNKHKRKAKNKAIKALHMKTSSCSFFNQKEK